MPRYLITGGLGFIGTALATTLGAKGHQVRIIDNLSGGRRENVPSDWELVIGDVRDKVLVGEAMSGVDGCFHLATSGKSATHDNDDLGCNNLPGMINVLMAAKDSAGKKPVPVVYASSSITYGDNAHTSLHEYVAARPLTSAAADKTSMEMHARVASLAHGIPTTGLRLFSIYGHAPSPKIPGSGVIATFIERIMRDQAITIYGDGQQARDFVYLQDAVKFFTTAMSMPTRQPAIYNVCTGTPTSIRQLAHLLFSLCGKPVEMRYAPARKGDVCSSVGNPVHAIRHLGLRASTTLAEGLQHMLSHRPGKAKIDNNVQSTTSNLVQGVLAVSST